NGCTAALIIEHVESAPPRPPAPEGVRPIVRAWDFGFHGLLAGGESKAISWQQYGAPEGASMVPLPGTEGGTRSIVEHRQPR
ncbi:MAG: hypothetical protein KC731_37170, partial [Myxococcales bacterium]|nr:hypothetical protein [Myxococcales bacterium]